MCSERMRLQELATTIQSDLEREILAPSLPTSEHYEIGSPSERAMRIALFSCHIDLTFHKARCLVCRAGDVHNSTAEMEWLMDRAA